MAKAVRAGGVKRGLTFKRLSVDSDARIALEGAFSGKSGIIVIAGTGSIVFGKSKRGSILRSGGWGRTIGDEGSGYALGRELFRAVAAELDGRGRATALRRLLARHYSLRTQPDIIRAIYKEDLDIASVAPLVTKAAAGGDVVAKQIVRNAAMDLVEVIAPVVQRLTPRTPKKGGISLVFIGSLLTTKNAFSVAVRRYLGRSRNRVKIHPPDAPPVHGASLMALRLL